MTDERLSDEELDEWAAFITKALDDHPAINTAIGGTGPLEYMHAFAHFIDQLRARLAAAEKERDEAREMLRRETAALEKVCADDSEADALRAKLAEARAYIESMAKWVGGDTVDAYAWRNQARAALARIDSHVDRPRPSIVDPSKGPWHEANHCCGSKSGCCLRSGRSCRCECAKCVNARALVFNDPARSEGALQLMRVRRLYTDMYEKALQLARIVDEEFHADDEEEREVAAMVSVGLASIDGGKP
jgi:hypothetical protein